jgi:hypothetical protein
LLRAAQVRTASWLSVPSRARRHREALASAIATQLHDRNRSFALFATHCFELTAFAAIYEDAINGATDDATARIPTLWKNID